MPALFFVQAHLEARDGKLGKTEFAVGILPAQGASSYVYGVGDPTFQTRYPWPEKWLAAQGRDCVPRGGS
jgi:hypothetical protein